MRRFRVETLVAAPSQVCFDLSLSVDAHRAAMARSGERAVAGVTEGVMGPGDSVTWRARHFGVPFRMTSVITAHDRPRRFVDEQASGPFASWRHEHTFTPVGTGTLMVDDVAFAAPLGPLGRLAERWVLVEYMPRLIRERNDWLRRTIEGHGTA